MAKDWWFKFEWNDWLSDEQLSLCSFETQGFWLRCICLMRRSNRYELTGSLDQMRRLFGCLPEEVTRCSAELKSTGAADVRFGNGEISIKSRRLEREHNDKERNRLYQAKHREKDESKTSVRQQSKSKSKEIEEEKKEEGKKPPTSDLEKDLLILKTESVLNLKLSLDQKRTVVEAIPTEFTEDWGVYLKARSLKFKNANQDGIVQALSYALTDYRRDNKYAYEKLNRPQPKLPTLAEKIAEEERHRAAPKNDPSKFVCGMPAPGHLDSNAIR